MNTLYEEIGQRIKRQRENKNLSQEELAIKIGLTRTSITNLEAGRQNISLKTLSDISDALNIGARDFLPIIKGRERINETVRKEYKTKLKLLTKQVNNLKLLSKQIKNLEITTKVILSGIQKLL